MIVDAHLDVAWNAIYNGRDLTLPLERLREAERRVAETAMTTLPAMAKGGVGLVFATLFAEPADPWSGGAGPATPTAVPLKLYTTPAEAEEQALEMLDVYRRWEEAGAVRIVTSRAGLDDHVRRFADDGVVGLVLLMEGADPIAAPDRLADWWERGVRIVGLAWGQTGYAGGTGSSAGLTGAGRELLAAMAEMGVIHDASHLSEEAFWESMALPHHAACATHANARRLMYPGGGARARVPLNRHLSDDQIAEVTRARGAASSGVVGLVLLNAFLEPRWSPEEPGTAVTVRDQGAAHMRHVAGLAGWHAVGIGSDVDAGYGAEETPADVESIERWAHIGDCVPADAREGVLGGNWLRFLGETLPER